MDCSNECRWVDDSFKTEEEGSIDRDHDDGREDIILLPTAITTTIMFKSTCTITFRNTAVPLHRLPIR